MIFDALARWPTGALSQSPPSVILPAITGSTASAGAGADFRLRLQAGQGVHVLAGQPAAIGLPTPRVGAALAGSDAQLRLGFASASGGLVLSGAAAIAQIAMVATGTSYSPGVGAAGLTRSLAAAVGLYRGLSSFDRSDLHFESFGVQGFDQPWRQAITSVAYSATVAITFRTSGGAISIAAGPSILRRTGDDWDWSLGGIGHYLEEQQRQRDLKAITRKAPHPIVTRPWPALPPADQHIIAGATLPAPPTTGLPRATSTTKVDQTGQAAAARSRNRTIIELLLLDAVAHIPASPIERGPESAVESDRSITALV